MKKKDTPTVVRIEINSGTFTIPAGDKIYEITVRQNPTISEALDAIVAHECAVETAHVSDKNASHSRRDDMVASQDQAQNVALYREISEEMFKEIGRLARELAISIKDLPSSYHREVDFEKAGLDLESAKGMLEEVVKMTESATMDIMDISEDMQEQCAIIRSTLDDVRSLNFVGNAVAGSGTSARKDPIVLIHEMLIRLRTVRDSLLAQLEGHNTVGDARTPEHESLAAACTDITAQISLLEQEYNSQLESSDRYMVVNDSYSMVKKDDHDRLIAALESSDHVIQCIISNIGRILESLSFQDLSGQRIIKIVDLLSNVQIQLLSILVSSGVKLKRLREGRVLEKTAAEAEVDALMSRFRADMATDGKPKNILDQQAIDSLLSDLGF